MNRCAAAPDHLCPVVCCRMLYACTHVYMSCSVYARSGRYVCVWGECIRANREQSFSSARARYNFHQIFESKKQQQIVRKRTNPSDSLRGAVDTICFATRVWNSANPILVICQFRQETVCDNNMYTNEISVIRLYWSWHLYFQNRCFESKFGEQSLCGFLSLHSGYGLDSVLCSFLPYLTLKLFQELVYSPSSVRQRRYDRQVWISIKTRASATYSTLYGRLLLAASYGMGVY